MITWDPPRYAFVIPYLERPVAWYGILFVVGFFVGYFLMKRFLTEKLNQLNYPVNDAKSIAHALCDKLLWYLVLGTLVGARLGHVFLYDWELYRQHPLEIFKVWEGGLASHGGTVGVLIAIYLFTLRACKWVPELTLLNWMDLLATPVAFAVGCIRLGNFVNQEIVGTPTTMPWGVIFLNPVDALSIVPRHPVQLYEAGAYFLLFLVLLFIRRKGLVYPGFLSGIFLIWVFGSRFFLEFFKEHQNSILDQTYLQAGQILSIPFVMLGLFILFISYRYSKTS